MFALIVQPDGHFRGKTEFPVESNEEGEGGKEREIQTDALLVSSVSLCNNVFLMGLFDSSLFHALETMPTHRK